MSRSQSKTRIRILRASWDALEGGNSQVRMSDIAKAAGISRQALYLHFPSRAELLVATVRYLDEVLNVDERLAESRAAVTGQARLDAFVRAWGGYIPSIFGIARALIAMQDNDAEAAAAWADRMAAVRHGCAAAVSSLVRDGDLRCELSEAQATDLLWSILSVHLWESLVRGCGWSQEDYEEEVLRLARGALVG